MPNLLLERYLAGEHEQVWQDLAELGAAARSDFYYQDVKAVADETMRRARHNLESIIPKLDRMGYKFGSVEAAAIEDPFAAVEHSMRAMLERNKPARESAGVASDPAALMARVLEQAGQFNQPGFSPRNAHEAMMAQFTKGLGAMQEQMKQRAPEIAKMKEAAKKQREKFESKPSLENPLVFDPATKKAAKQLDAFERKSGGTLPVSVRSWYELVGGVSLEGTHESLAPQGSDSTEALLVFSFPDAVKFRDMMGGDGEDEDGVNEFFLWAADGDQYSIKFPDAGADPEILGVKNRTFVGHLRIAFAWGGFPGWAGAANPPLDLLGELREGLLPL